MERIYIGTNIKNEKETKNVERINRISTRMNLNWDSYLLVRMCIRTNF
jgi:hypothetical protein